MPIYWLRQKPDRRKGRTLMPGYWNDPTAYAAYMGEGPYDDPEEDERDDDQEDDEDVDDNGRDGEDADEAL
jgi:hypothetical protein